MDTALDGRTAVVPGSSGGLGLAVARALAAEGANVVMAARRGDVVRAEAEELGSAIGVELDLDDAAAPRTLVEQAEKHFGAVDIVVVNSGGPPPGTAVDVTEDELAAAVHRLLQQHQRLVAAVLPGMRERGWGRVIAIGSSGVQQPIENLALSNIGRAGLAAYLKSLAAQVAEDGVTVNMVLPGRIATDRVASLDRAAGERAGITAEEARARSVAAIPAGRYGTPEEFAAVVAFLASPAASYVTGEQIRCDGGMIRSY
ncbi:MAG: SDR family oxidoreductase [Propionibacteriales bacterium]|nr:SDR family oxidoreductase [Propionibacteriales bacterium]